MTTDGWGGPNRKQRPGASEQSHSRFFSTKTEMCEKSGASMHLIFLSPRSNFSLEENHLSDAVLTFSWILQMGMCTSDTIMGRNGRRCRKEVMLENERLSSPPYIFILHSPGAQVFLLFSFTFWVLDQLRQFILKSHVFIPCSAARFLNVNLIHPCCCHRGCRHSTADKLKFSKCEYSSIIKSHT